MKQLLLLLFISLSFIGSTPIAYAQPAEGTITSNSECGRMVAEGEELNECDFDDLIKLVQNVIRFTIVYIIIPLITLVVLYYGVMMVIAGNKPAQLQKAKKALWSVVVGLFFMLTAWLLVSAAIRAFDVQVNTDPTQGPIKLLDTDN
jgi:hypothetical protein